MNGRSLRILLGLILLGCAGLPLLARAAEPGLPLWEAGVLGGPETTPAYPGSAGRSARAIALPLLIYRGKVLRSDRSGVGARLMRTDQAELDVGFALALPARSSDV